MNKEIEKVFTERGFTNIEQMATMFDYYKLEIERLNNIIKEVREYIEQEQEKNYIICDYDIELTSKDLYNDILEILDKGE